MILGSASGYKPMTAAEYELEKVESYNANVGNLNEVDGYDCKVCKNKGFVAELKYMEIYGYPVECMVDCKCMKVRKALKRLAKSGLKDVIKKYTFDRYLTEDGWQQSIKDNALRFCQEAEDDWFFIGGQSGAGKSHICTAIAVHYLRKGKSCKYMLWRDDIQRLNMSITDPENFLPMMDEFKKSDVLYIDDLFKAGKEDNDQGKKPTSPQLDRTFEILNYRYNNPGLITIISSERCIFEISEIDEAIAGRIAEQSKKNGFCFNLKKDSNKNWRMKGVVEL